jgi:hypothetical protein
VWFQPPQNWLAQRLYNENSKETAKETNENRKWNWKRNRNKTESDPINKNEPWTDKLKMNWLTAQTNWIISKWASPKKVTAGWARRDVICRALCCLFLIFEQRSYCPASISRTSWPPTPAKTNSGTLTCYRLWGFFATIVIIVKIFKLLLFKLHHFICVFNCSITSD